MQANTVQSQTKLFLFSKISISKEFGIHMVIFRNFLKFPKIQNWLTLHGVGLHAG